jgi:lipopolysaccharide transport system ATP-binding protein
MQLRLAFAVAAHLKPEVLMIDEVLAVGDMEFQKKCLGKMKEVSNEQGRTILLVSHNMNYISSICTKCILLDHGRIKEAGSANQVIGSYITQIEQRSSHYIWPETDRPGNDIVKLESVRIVDEYFNTAVNLKVTEKVGIEMNYEVLKENHILWLGHNVYNQFGVNVFDTHNVNSPYYTTPHLKGRYTSVVWIPANLLNSGTYYIGSAIFNHAENFIHFHEKDIVLFKVYDVPDQTTAKGSTGGDFPGVIRPLLDWSIDKI